MSTQHEALELARILRHKIPSIKCLELSADRLEQQHALIVQMAEALEKMATYHRNRAEGRSMTQADAMASAFAFDALATAKEYLK